jgi:DNA (cytosine-5)-methyltransferase 1
MERTEIEKKPQAKASVNPTFRLLDAFCCQGGAGEGYARAGFIVEGVDNKPQPKYPYKFHLFDALEFIEQNANRFDAFHASPPCQGWTKAKSIWGRVYQDWIEPTRNLLDEIGKPYVIENVPGAPLKNPATLSGGMFGLKVIRRRLFETNWLLFTPPKRMYRGTTNSHRGLSTSGDYISVAGHNFLVHEAREAMGIIWMTQKGLSQAIPPAYTEWVGRQLLEVCKKGL